MREKDSAPLQDLRPQDAGELGGLILMNLCGGLQIPHSINQKSIRTSVGCSFYTMILLLRSIQFLWEASPIGKC